jgi:predicted YcjX-like family ATPase
MSMDALVQYLVSRKWRDFLVLQGPLPADAMTTKAFEASAKKFGARIVAKKDFKPGTDPRQRELNNPALLTSGTRDYDVAFVADDAFEFARQVPYQTARARPVVGDQPFAVLLADDLIDAQPPALAQMARRFEAYKSAIVRPFFRDHFARLDRQIVLVDALAALNAGPAALVDLETALADILAAFRLGRANWLTGLVRRRIDRIVFAATKADHLHHTSHDRLEAILALLTEDAMTRAKYAGAEVKALALAAIRATKEGMAKRNGQALPCIVGYPLPGETIGRRHFDGNEAFAIFPGDLPADPETALRHPHAQADDVRFVRFRPPDPVPLPSGGFAPFPNIRLDRALQALIGDRLT